MNRDGLRDGAAYSVFDAERDPKESSLILHSATFLEQENVMLLSSTQGDNYETCHLFSIVTSSNLETGLPFLGLSVH